MLWKPLLVAVGGTKKVDFLYNFIRLLSQPLVCVVFSLLTFVGVHAQSAERRLPAPEPYSEAALESPESAENDCQDSTFQPLSALTVNTQPRRLLGIDTGPELPRPCPLPRLPNERKTPEVGMYHDPHLLENFFCRGTVFCHQPLYYEERCLERYAYCRPWRPVLSAAHFAGNTLLLPIHKYHHRHHRCVSTLCAFY